MNARLFRDVFVIEAKRTMSYRVDFWISVIGGLISGIAIPYFMWRWIYDWEVGEAGVIVGRTFGQMLAYYIAYALLSRVVRGVDLPMSVSSDIYEGGLNRYLLYPTRYLPFKYAQQLGGMVPHLVQLFAFGAAFLWFIEVPEGVGVTAATVLMGLGSAFVANLLYFLLTYPIQLVSFWADNVWSLLVLLRFVTSLLGGGMLPLELFPSFWRDVLSYTPFPTLFYLPVQTLLGEVSVGAWAQSLVVGLGWCVALAAVSHVVWRRGELRYSGVGI
ncbi:MAG: ABC-2 family transporter protein [Planctomycetota bacterium]